MQPTPQTQTPTPWTRTVLEFLAACWAGFTDLFAAPQSAAAERAAEKRRQKSIRRRLRGLSPAAGSRVAT
ncbi:MAG TPA: hypothetical protein VF796_15085 [Humisphaera sp.]